MRSSCSAASLVEHVERHEAESTLQSDVGHYKTTCGKAYNGILAEKLLANLQGSRRLVHVTDAGNLSKRLKVIELVDLKTCDLRVPLHWVLAQPCVSSGVKSSCIAVSVLSSRTSATIPWSKL